MQSTIKAVKNMQIQTEPAMHRQAGGIFSETQNQQYDDSDQQIYKKHDNTVQCGYYVQRR